MPLSSLLKSCAATCPFCNQKAGITTREHSQCRRSFEAGFQEMVNLGSRRRRTHTFDEKALRLSMAKIARHSYGDGTTVNQVLEEGWKLGVAHAMSDGILTQQEEHLLRQFRDRLALADSGADRKATSQLEKGSTDRLMLDARLAAIAVDDPETHLRELSESLRQSTLYGDEKQNLLARAWEAAVESALEDGLPTLDEENALNRYMDHFGLTAEKA